MARNFPASEFRWPCRPEEEPREITCMQLRFSEWIYGGFFCLILLFCIILPVPRRGRLLVVAANISILAIALGFPLLQAWMGTLFVSIARDWFPAPLILIAYWETGLFIGPRRNQKLERFLLGLDRIGLDRLRLIRVMDLCPRWLNEYLEISYLLCYPLVPLGLGVLYLLRLGRFADQFWTAVLPAVLVCYGLSGIFPSLPPRTLLAAGRPAEPAFFFRSINLWLTEHASIQANTFPSAHVAGTVATALMVMHHNQLVGTFFLVVALSIAVATVYGRYHYAADSIAGAFLGLLTCALARGLHSWFGPP